MHTESPGAFDRPAERWRSTDIALAAILFVIVGATALFFRLGTYRTLGSHEAFAAVPAREMLASGDWLVPRYGGLPRLEKPPLPYWVVAGAGALFGEVNEWTARLPAAVAAVGLALLMGRWGFCWYGATAGWATALVQITSLYAITFGRKAEIDMLLWLCMTGAMFLIVQQPPDEPRRRAFLRWSGIFSLLSVSWLAKFHYGPVLVLAPTVIYYLVQRRPRALWQLANPLGLVVFAAAVCVWPWLVMRAIPDAWSVWHEETVGRALGELGREPVWFYVPQVAWMALPWLPLAAGAVPASWRDAWRCGDARERFLWVWFVTQLLIVSVAADKHKHYIVPALPIVSLMAGRVLGGLVERYRCGAWRLGRNSALLLWIGAWLLAAAGVGFVTHRWPAQAVIAVTAATVYVVCAGAALCLFRSSRARSAAVAVTAQYAVSFALVIGWIAPAADRHRPMIDFTRHVAARTPPDKPLVLYRMDQDPAVFYAGTRARRVESAEDLSSVLSEYGRIRVMTFAPYVPELGDGNQRRLVSALDGDSNAGHPKDGPRYLIELAAPAIVPVSFADRDVSRGTVTQAKAEN